MGGSAVAPRLLVGTSGYSYKQWRGAFYPEKLPAEEMLRFYAERFPAVEVNNTFYRMPTPEGLARWAEQTPPDFTFVLKAPQRITHQGRLGNLEAAARFFDAASVLGARLGPALFQLPPRFPADLERLGRFLTALPRGRRAAFEFRHASWFREEVYALLRAHGAALCVADVDEAEATPMVPTAGWAYLRLRRAGYSLDDLQAWRARLASQPWSEAFVFFKHEEEARGPSFARQLQELG